MFYAWKNITYTLNGFRKSDADIKVIRKQRATTSLHKILRKHCTLQKGFRVMHVLFV